MEQRGKELEDRDMEQVVRERWRTEDGNEGDGVMEDGGWSGEGCWLQNKEHGIDAEASQNLKVIEIKEQRKR